MDLSILEKFALCPASAGDGDSSSDGGSDLEVVIGNKGKGESQPTPRQIMERVMKERATEAGLGLVKVEGEYGRWQLFV